MTPTSLLYEISIQFLKEHNVYRYQLKKVSEMSEDELISCCHRYCEENNLMTEWTSFRNKIESEYLYCSFIEKYIDEGYCCDLQMIRENMIKPSALPELDIDKEQLRHHCSECKHCW